MATVDERLAVLIRENQAQNEKWAELKAKLIARGNTPIIVTKEMLDKIEGSERMRPTLLTPVKGSPNN